MNAEFPEEGKFQLTPLPGNRYKVCGDPEEVHEVRLLCCHGDISKQPK